MASGEKIEMIIDCDPGVDDAVAIMMALSQPSVNLLAITCVGGNTPIDNVLRNALRVLKLCDRTDVPVFRGSGNSLLNPNYVDAHHVHGSDGLGGVPDPDPPSLDLIQSEHAVHAMIRITKEKPGQVTMVAIGPLTNLALAIRLDPGFTGRLKKLVIMGGNTEGSGSMTDAAEFNFFCDPEAAHIVLHEVKCPTTVVGWETCLKNGLPWEWYDQWSSKKSPKATFLNKIMRAYIELKRHRSMRKFFSMCDPLAMAVAINPAMVTESVHLPVYIEIHGAVTRGQMVSVVKNTQGLELGSKIQIVKRCNTEPLASMYKLEWFDKWSATPTPKGHFVNAILEGQFMMYERGEIKRPLFKVCDALAMAVVIRPEMVLESLTCPVKIELSGQVTRGQMVKRVKNKEGLPLGPEVEVVLRCNTEILRVMFEDSLTG